MSDGLLHQPDAFLTQVAGGIEFTVKVTFTGDETPADMERMRAYYDEAYEQVQLIVTTLRMVDFEAPEGTCLMQRNGLKSWRSPLISSSSPTPEPLPAEPPSTEPPPVVTAVQHLLNGNDTSETPAPEPEDRSLRRLVEGRSPSLNGGLAGALTQALPPEERPTLARALGKTAEEIYLWLYMQRQKDPKRKLRIGEIAEGTGHSAYVCANRLGDLESGGLVEKSTIAGSGRHRRWAVYQAKADPATTAGTAANGSAARETVPA